MRITTVLYGTAIFLGAFLLFLVEPMAAKRLLPLLGGSAAVWTTCLVFFQTALLLGYLLAHWLATKFEPRVQALVYIGLLVAGLAQAFINIHPNLHASTGRPIASVFQVLSVLIGLPFLVLSATNPLLQSWYARLAGGTGSGGLTPPYRLFSLSNLGSLLALIAYPSLLEPNLSLHAQNVIWVAGLLVLVIASVTIRARSSMPAGQSEPTIDPAAVDVEEKAPSHGDRALWLLLPACGSLLLCSFTNHLSQNIAAIPLLWIIPLIAYLMSFVVAFNGSRWYPRLLVHCLLMPLLLFIGYLLYQRNIEEGLIYKLIPHISSPRIAVPIFCGVLFLACLFCHGELYRLRPSPRYATSYYLMIAAGGAMGAIFVGVAAPLIFSAYYELDVALVLTGMLALIQSRKSGLAWIVLWSVVVPGSLTLAILEARAYGEYNLAQVRSFYGAMRVSTANFGDPGMGRSLFHGTIEHGAQLDLQPNLPTTYYAEDSGVGLALRLCCGDRPRRVGIIGLGAGTVAAYGRKGDLFRFYEINPQMVKISAEFFTFVHDSAATVEIEMGDARLSLEKEPPQNYDVLVVDAFSGDAIPVHLLTQEAFALYRRHLQPNGIIAIHISNQFLDLGPEVKQQAELAGMTAVLIPSYDDDSKAEYEADWVLVTANQEFLKEAEVGDPKGEIKVPRRLRAWTDDYNSLLPLLK